MGSVCGYSCGYVYYALRGEGTLWILIVGTFVYFVELNCCICPFYFKLIWRNFPNKLNVNR